MKCTIERDELRSALKVTAPAVSRSMYKPVLTGARLDLTGDALTVTCTDLDRMIRHECAARGGTDGVAIAPASVLRRVADACGAGAVTLAAGDGILTVSDAAGFTTTLNTLDPSAWPQYEPLDDPGPPIDITGELRRIIERAVITASSDPDRPVLCGVWLYGDGRVISSDSYVGSHAATSHALPELTVPATALGDALKAAPDTLEMRTSWDDIELSSGGTTWACRSTPGDRPDLERLIPVEEGDVITVDKSDLLGAIAALGAIGGEGKDGHRTPVLLSADGDSLAITKAVRGVAESTVTVDCTGVLAKTIGLDPLKVASVLGAVDADAVAIHTHGPHKPVVIVDGPTTLMIMPVRVA